MTSDKHKLTHCPNCNQPLAAKDRYCRNCGQSTRNLKVPFKHLVLEAIEGVLHVDNNIFRTVGALLFKPGLLTKEFIAGRRKKFVPPVRLYIFISFIFFLVLTINPGHIQINDSGKESAAEAQNFIDSEAYNQSVLSLNGLKTEELKGLNDAQIDSVMTAKEIERTWFNRFMARRLARIGNSNPEEFRHQTHKGVSYMMFFLMPVFGWLIYLFYNKKANYYLDCLIFSVHFHCFVFVLLLLYKISEWFISYSELTLVVLGLIYIYLTLASRGIFGQSWIKTLIKTLAILLIYSFLTIISLVFVIILSVVAF
jgi:hypothetical protein